MTTTPIRDFCGQIYSDSYTTQKHKMENEALARSKKGSISASKHNEIETAAQKEAIKQAVIEGIKRFSDVEPAAVWRAIYESHVHRKSGISDADTISKVISADQSWRKSSGHAFEELLKIYGTDALRADGIEIVLQRDLNVLIKAKK